MDRRGNMRTNLKCLMTMMVAASWLSVAACGAVTNSVPWTDSFESYASGASLVGSGGWSALSADGGVVTNNAILGDALTNYPVGGRSYPLPGATHTNILQISAELANAVRSPTGGVVQVDLLALPSWNSSLPTGQTNDQCAFFIGSNGLANIWHQDRTAVPFTNVWQELTNSPVVASNVWVRFTVIQDYSNSMFQLKVNEAEALVDGRGWSYGGGGAGGSWFYMVQTNRALATVVADASPAWVDDVTAQGRLLVWSGSNLVESVTNNGSVDTSSPITVALTRDTFTGTPGDDLVAAGKLVVSGMPSNLAAVATLVDGTNVTITLTNRALLHEASHTVSNLVMQFADGAFVLGRAWDVAGSVQTNVLVFHDTPSLGYGGLSFTESSANDGSVSGSLIVTLTNGTFNGGVGEDFATNSLKVQLLNVPAGLTGHVVVAGATQVQVSLGGRAVSHAAANGVTNLQVQWQAGAFSIDGAPLSSVFNTVTNFTISYTDPSSLGYGSTVFAETVTNNGTVGGTTLTLVNKAFDAAADEDMVGNGKITVANLPAGLGLQIVRGASAQTATLVFTGAATSHAAANSIANLTITLTDGAVVGGNASAVSNYSRNDLAITFSNPRILAYSATLFSELCGGAIDNRTPVTITLTGDTLTGANGDDFVAAGRIAAANLPDGLTARITRSSATQLSVTLLGAAVSHASGDSVANVSFTFANTAFTAGNAVFVTNYQLGGITVAFNDSTFYNVLPFEDSFEEYAVGLRITGSNGWSASFTTEAGIATNDAAAAAGLAAYRIATAHDYPVSGTHTQVLCVQDDLGNAVHSESAPTVYVDFMTQPVAVQDSPTSDTNDQFACYVTTNGMLVVWHRNSVAATNEWITLSNAPAISTSAWVRLTVESDYVHSLFQVRINESAPVSDPRGWTQNGAAPTGSWFRMVQTNGSMSTFKITGSGAGLLDDFTVRTALPAAFGRTGAVYLFR